MNATREHFIVETPTNSPRIKHFLGLSDLHYCERMLKYYPAILETFYRELVDRYQENVNLDAILIAGDLVSCGAEGFANQYYFEVLREDLSYLSDVFWAPVLVSLGNHDILENWEHLTEHEKSKFDMMMHLHSPEHGIYVLHNSQYVDSEFTVTGYTPKREFYSRFHPQENACEVCEDFQKQHFVFPKDHVNILLCHSNEFFMYPDILKYYPTLYQDVTILFGGHAHDGFVPRMFQPFLGESMETMGIVRRKMPFASFRRGGFVVSEKGVSKPKMSLKDEDMKLLLQEEEMASIISRGVAKYSWYFPSSPSYTEIEVVRDYSRSRKL